MFFADLGSSPNRSNTNSEQLHRLASMIKTVLVSCAGCSKDFQKAKGEVVRAGKRGAKHYCSNKCQALHANNSKGNPANLHPGSETDEWSPFRYFMWKIRSRHKTKGFAETDLTLAYLKRLWEEQKGQCPLSGWNLRLPVSMTEWSEGEVTPSTASLDRIRPNEPYSQGNVRFIAHIANMAKYTYTDQDVIEFCKAVSTKMGF